MVVMENVNQFSVFHSKNGFNRPDPSSFPLSSVSNGLVSLDTYPSLGTEMNCYVSGKIDRKDNGKAIYSFLKKVYRL